MIVCNCFVNRLSQRNRDRIRRVDDGRPRSNKKSRPIVMGVDVMNIPIMGTKNVRQTILRIKYILRNDGAGGNRHALYQCGRRRGGQGGVAGKG